MLLWTTVVARYTIVTAIGELDFAAKPQLRQCLQEVLNRGARAVVLDIDGIAFVDSTALSALVDAYRQVAELHGALTLVCSNEQTLRTFRLTGLDRVFTIRASVAEAVE